MCVLDPLIVLTIWIVGTIADHVKTVNAEMIAERGQETEIVVIMKIVIICHNKKIKIYLATKEEK
jgi:hypothetical protein